MDLYDSLFAPGHKLGKGGSGLALGIVKENWDEANQGKVKVEFFLGEEGKIETAWVRVASVYTENQAGIYFLPEIGTEVVVGFIGGSENEPIVIGSLWNDTNATAYAVEENTVKALRTKAGHEIIFQEEEEKGEIQIRTVGKLNICLADETRTIQVANEDKDSMLEIDFENGKIALNAKTEICLSIAGSEAIQIKESSVTIKSDDIKLESGGGLAIKGQSTEIKGNSISMQSDAACGVKGGTTLKLEGATMSELKGQMVKIN